MNITEVGAYPPVTTQAPDAGVAVGDHARGTCVTMGSQHTGRVIEIATPRKYSGQHGNRYRIVTPAGTRHWIDGVRRLDPADAARQAAATAGTPDERADAAYAAATDAGASQHLAASLAATARQTPPPHA